MPTNITKYELLISCPGDVKDEVEIIKESVHQFNSTFSNALGIMIQERYWANDAHPETGDEAQKILNKQIVDKCDAAVAIFWTRFGTPTDDYYSGSEEEIEKMIASKKNVFLYFSNVPVSPNIIDNEQYQKIIEYKEKFIKNKKGLYWEYSSLDDFKKLFYAHLAQYFLSLPKLKKIADGKKPIIEVELIDAEKDDIPEEVYRYKRANGLIRYRKLSKDDLFEDIADKVTIDDLNAYNEALPSENEIDAFNKQQKLYEDAKNNCYEFKLSVSNIGNTKANEIFVDLKFPKEILVYRENDVESVKKPDEKPNMPRDPIMRAIDEKCGKQIQKFNRGINSFMIGSNLLKQVADMNNFSNTIASASFVSPILTNYNSLLPTNVDYCVKDNNILSLYIDNLLHTRRYNSNNFTLVFTECGEFEAKYSVMCEEWEEPIEGCFKLKSEY